MAASTSRELTAFLERLEGGETPTAAQLGSLCALDRQEERQLAEAWPRIPGEVRASVMARAAEIAEDNVDLVFEELARVALDDPLPEVRAKAAEALWESESREAARRLADLVRSDPDDTVREAVAAALGHYVLLREFDQFDAATGDLVVDALRAAAEDDEEDAEVRGRALEGLGSRSLPWVADLIAEHYESDDRRLRLASLHAMGDSADERWLDYVHEQFYSDDPEFRFEAAVAAGGIASGDSVEPLLPLLDDDDSQVSIAAIEALGEIGGQDAVEALEAFAPRASEAQEVVLAPALEQARDGGSGHMDDDWDDDYEDDDE
jgi:HEAT repeat protein